MRLNTKGQALGRGHIDGHALPFPSWVEGYTEFCWLDPDTPIAQLTGGTRAEIHKFQSGAWVEVSNIGTNYMRAGKGRYYAFPRHNSFAPADVDPYLGTAVLTVYETGSDLILVDLDGLTTTVKTGALGTDAIAFSNARQRDGWLLYQADGVWHLVAPIGLILDIAPRREAVDYAVPVAVSDGRVVLLERASGRLTLRYPDTTLGWLVSTDTRPDGLVAPDAIEIGTGVRVAWSSDQSESAEAFWWTDVTLDDAARIDLDAEVLPPVESVPLLGRPFGLAVYTFNNTETPGNLQLPIRPSVLVAGVAPFIATVDDESDIGDVDLFAVYAPEEAIDRARAVGDIRARGLAIYQDSYPMRETVINLVTEHDIATPQLYREPNETTPEFDARMKTEYLRIDAEIPTGAECWPTVNIHQRYDSADPTLSVREVVEGFVAATNRAHADAWPGMVLFRHGTMDVPDEIYPYIARFLLGITATPEARIIPIPEDPDMATTYVLLKKPDAAKDPIVTATRVEEVQDGGKLFLKKPDDGDKMVCVNPDLGIEERPPNTHGAWEEFVKTQKGDYAAVRGPNKVGVIVAV